MRCSLGALPMFFFVTVVVFLRNVEDSSVISSTSGFSRTVMVALREDLGLSCSESPM